MIKSKNYLISSISFLATTIFCSAQTFTLNPFTPGDTTISWNVLGSDMVSSGVLTATSTNSLNLGFAEASGGSFADFSTGAVSASPFSDHSITLSFVGEPITPVSGYVNYLTWSSASIDSIKTFPNATVTSVNAPFMPAGSPVLQVGDNIATSGGIGTSLGIAVNPDVPNFTNQNQPYSFEFNNGELGSIFVAHQTGNMHLGFQFDVVPEPSSVTLLGLGSLALILRRKK